VVKPLEVCSIQDVPPDSGREFLVGGRAIALWNLAGRFYATDARCPHADGPLSSGSLSGTEITCPMHGWRFEIVSGEGLDPAEGCLRTYPIFRRGDRLWVLVDEATT
jgi:nitrite reductase (NADH) small subunit